MANLNINDSPDSGKRIMTHAHQGLKRLTGHSKSHVLHIFPYMNIPEKRVPFSYSLLHFTLAL